MAIIIALMSRVLFISVWLAAQSFRTRVHFNDMLLFIQSSIDTRLHHQKPPFTRSHSRSLKHWTSRLHHTRAANFHRRRTLVRFLARLVTGLAPSSQGRSGACSQARSVRAADSPMRLPECSGRNSNFGQDCVVFSWMNGMCLTDLVVIYFKIRNSIDKGALMKDRIYYLLHVIQT